MDKKHMDIIKAMSKGKGKYDEVLDAMDKALKDGAILNEEKAVKFLKKMMTQDLEQSNTLKDLHHYYTMNFRLTTIFLKLVREA